MVKLKCEECSKSFEARYSRRFCSHSCSAKHNNKIRTRKDAKKLIPCENCGTETKNKKFCSIECSSQYRTDGAYDEFKNSVNKEYKDSYSPKTFKPHILREQGQTCAVCKRKDTWEGKILVFVLDHIDGNSNNNNRSNLRLVCPNCDSQLDTFKSKNKGNGRFYRRIRRLEGKSF